VVQSDLVCGEWWVGIGWMRSEDGWMIAIGWEGMRNSETRPDQTRPDDAGRLLL